MPRFKEEQLPELAKAFEDGASARELRDTYNLGAKALLRHLVEARNKGLITDAAMARVLIDRTQYDFPENSEAQLEAVLNCVNSESKAAAMLMVDESLQTAYSIRKKLAALVHAHLPSHSVFKSYCEDSLSPIGFLVQELFGYDGLLDKYFFHTAAGKTFQPIAAFSIVYAGDNNVPLHSLFGQTSSRGDSRAPYNRARIVELVAEGCCTIESLQKMLDLPTPSVTVHLKHLQDLGLLAYDSRNNEQKGQNLYRWVKGKKAEDAKSTRRDPQLARNVAAWLEHHDVGGYNQIATEMGYSDTNHAARNRISAALADLAKQGLAVSRFDPGTESEIVLLKESSLMTNFIRPIRRALEGGPELAAMRWLYQELHQNPALFGRYLDAAIELYNATSPHINALPPGDGEDAVRKFVAAYTQKHGYGPRPTEVARQFGWNVNTTHHYISALRDGGFLTSEKHGKVVRYSPA